MPLITKQDLINRTRISAQLSDRQVLPFIEDAETYDLPKVLSSGLIADVTPLAIIADPYATATAYLTDAYAVYGGVYYKALADTTGVLPDSDAAVWEADYKATLRYKHLPDFLIWSAYSRMLLEIGRNPTEAGLTVPSDPGVYEQISDKGRAELIQSAKDKATFHRMQISGFLAAHNLNDTNTCSPSGTRRYGRINAI